MTKGQKTISWDVVWPELPVTRCFHSPEGDESAVLRDAGNWLKKTGRYIVALDIGYGDGGCTLTVIAETRELR